MDLAKGEELEWFLEDKNTLLLVRKDKKPPRKFRSLT